MDFLSETINQIPTIWVLAGSCLLFMLVLAGLLFLWWVERRWKLAKRLRLSWKFLQLDAIRPYANQILSLDRYRRHAGQFQREAQGYMPDSMGDRLKQGQQQFRRSAADLPTDELRDQVTEVMPGEPGGSDNGAETAVIAPQPPSPSGPTLAAQAPGGLTTSTPIPQSPAPNPQSPAPGPQIHIGRLPRHEGEPVPLTSDRLPVGRYIDRYQIDAFIGDGSTGTVYQVYDAVLGRKAILKIIHPRLAAQPGFTERLTEAIQASASLDHPGIVAIEQYAVTPERTYLLREFITGPTLDRFARQQQGQNQFISLNHTLRLAAQVADALAHAHRRGLVHGRIQPGNVLLKALDRPDRQGDPPLRAMLTDFGLARLFAAGDVYGEVAMENMRPYVSPEHCRGEALDSRSDIYSLGMMLYQLTTQQLPFNPTSLEEAHRLHLNEMPPLPTSIRPIIPEPVEAIILKAIAKAPAERYQSGAEMADALRQVVVKPTDVAAVYDQTPALAAAGDYQIIVTSEGEPVQTITVDDEMVSIGSATQNDIVLPGKGIARQHVRLERTASGWQIIDLGSLHGSYLDSVQLLPDLPERWLAHQTLQLGPYMLRWQPYDPQRVAVQPVSMRPETAVMAEEPLEAVRVTLSPEQVTVTPGERVDLQINLTNRGNHVDHFGIQVDGLPAEWVTISEDEMQLMPAGRGHLLLTFHPPRHSRVTARDYTFRVVGVSRSNPAVRGLAQARLTVRPFSRLRFEIQPEHLRNGGACHVLLHNEGNQRLQARVLGRDPADAIRFEGAQEQVVVPAGEAREVVLELLPRERPLLGTTQYLPFEVLAQTETEEAPRVRPGQVEVRPFLPLWLPAVLSVLLIVCCTGFFLLNSLWASRTDESLSLTATAEAEAEMATALAQTVVTATATPRAVTPTPVPNPASCSMIRDQQPDVPDGEYELFYLGNLDMPFTVYCHNMQSRPAEYLPLVNVQGAFNYSMISYPEGAIPTHYQRLRIFPSTLVVDTADRTFATTLGSVPNYTTISEAATADYPVLATNYARAEGCNRGNFNAPPGQANIDLRGTGFAIEENVQFAFDGGNIQDPAVNLTENDQVANLSIGGRCAHIEPATQLRLIYIGVD
jgi:eukaryotic-like serine/threonine-protein kinase